MRSLASRRASGGCRSPDPELPPARATARREGAEPTTCSGTQDSRPVGEAVDERAQAEQADGEGSSAWGVSEAADARQPLQRQLEILNDREIRNLTWAAIARKHSMGEKEARETYYRYVREIAPLIVEQSPVETVHACVRLLEAARQRLSEVVDNADNDSARIGGLREITKTIVKEIDLLERAGLMPTNVADAHVRAEQERLLQRMAEVLRRHRVSPEVYEELAAVFDREDDR